VALSDRQERIVSALQDGLPLSPAPFHDLGTRVGLSGQAIIEGIRELLDAGIIKRLGVVVRHRRLGFTANAMVVWDVPDARVDAAGEWLGAQPRITLCYRRPRRPPAWPYNLFCMIHGRSRQEVRAVIQGLREMPQLAEVPYAVLFSTRCFTQRGARYRFDGPPGGEHDA
jgi:DNA-binding Lrp family transcriptional regulator